jgi:hypothetical protein
MIHRFHCPDPDCDCESDLIFSNGISEATSERQKNLQHR